MGYDSLGIAQNEANQLLRTRLHSEPDLGPTIYDHTEGEVPCISLDEFLNCATEEEVKTSDYSQNNRFEQHSAVILQPLPAPNHSELISPTQDKTRVSSLKTQVSSQGPMRDSSPLTPSPTSSSSQDNEEEMGYAGQTQFSIFRRNSAPIQLNFRESVLPRLTSPVTEEGSEDESQFQDSNSNSKSSRKRNVSRRSKKPVPDDKKDENYWRRRHKNNIAAKRSREARRQKETDLSKRAIVLEVEHEKLRVELQDARQENEELRLRLSKYEDISKLA